MTIKVLCFLVLAFYSGFLLLPLLGWLVNSFVKLVRESIDEAAELLVRIKLFWKHFRYIAR